MRGYSRGRFSIAAGFLLTIWGSVVAADGDLTKAVVITPEKLSKVGAKAVQMLVEEVHKRTQIRWEIQEGGAAAGAIVSLAIVSDGPAEGYRLMSSAQPPKVSVIGNDQRGLLFGVGRLLRELHMTKGKVTIADNLQITTAPKHPIRGHQLGYRPKTNSYDAWDLKQWEQYIRDLAVFGCNAVELIPPRSDDLANSPHFPLPPMEMMVGMSKLLDDYGMDVWIWYPALDRDYGDSKTVEFALKEWGEVFKRLPRIDAIFVPGGDPGHTPPKHLMPLLAKQTANLHRYHPKAQMWMSPQGFNKAWMDEFYEIMRKEQPAWLTGLVYGPQVRVSLPELRSAISSKYQIRRYPDITHSLRCQYPVPDWDLAHAHTAARECINPRPVDQAHIFHAFAKHAAGFITYSEGCNDDVNKAVWSALGWNPDENVTNVLRQYSRYFIGERFGDDFAQGLLALESNWRGPLLANDSVYTTLKQFQAMEKSASPQVLANWRFQQALYRAYYDAYQRRRLIYETELEEQATEHLRNAKKSGSLAAMNKAEEILAKAETEKVATAWRARVFELAEALFQSIQMQLSVERHKGMRGRGDNLDTIDMPLNNRSWLSRQFAELRKLESESERLRGIEAIVKWTDPGPGGFYDDLGNPNRQPHLVRNQVSSRNLVSMYANDPAFLNWPITAFDYNPGWRLSWCTHADALFDTSLKMRYADLDPKADYKIRVVYAGDKQSVKIRLVADEKQEIHPLIRKESPVKPVEFDIPAAATADGELTLTWNQEPGLGGGGRGCQVAEVWLIKK